MLNQVLWKKIQIYYGNSFAFNPPSKNLQEAEILSNKLFLSFPKHFAFVFRIFCIMVF